MRCEHTEKREHDVITMLGREESFLTTTFAYYGHAKVLYDARYTHTQLHNNIDNLRP